MKITEIVIDYTLHGSDAVHSMRLKPVEYFELDDGEVPDIDSVERHAHAVEYLSVSVDQVQRTMLRLVAPDGRARHTSEQFWCGGRNRLIERTDKGCAPYWEMILETQDESGQWEIVRVVRTNDRAELVSHVRISPGRDGVEEETVLYPSLMAT